MTAAVGFDRAPEPELPPLPVVEAELSVVSVKGTSRAPLAVNVSGSPEFVARVITAAADAAEEEHLR